MEQQFKLEDLKTIGGSIGISKKHLEKKPKKVEQPKKEEEVKPMPKAVPTQDVTKTTDAQIQKLLQQIPGATPEARGELLHQLINLVMQMGSDSKHLGMGLVDQRKFAVLNEMEQVALMHFAYRGQIDEIRYFAWLSDWILNSSPSINGLGRRQTIQLTAAASGSQQPEFMQKPNLLARTLWKRNWREEAEAEGKVVVE